MGKHRLRLLAAAVGAFLWTAAAGAFDFGVNEHGVFIKAESMGDFNIGTPVLTANGKDENASDKRMDGGKAVLRYPCGATITLRREGDEVKIGFSGVPGNSKYKMEMHIPGNYKDGAKWKIKDKEAAFPSAHTKGKPHLFQGNAGDFNLTSFDGRKIAIKLPADYVYQQLTDCREWNWGIFVWSFNNTIDGNEQRIVISSDASTAKRVIIVDKFGQTVAKDFPGKLKDEKEMQDEVAAEKAYYASLPQMKKDAFGGLPGSREKYGLKKTGFFHVEKKDNKWILVDPEGNACFHLGVCSFAFTEDYTYVQGRESIYEWLPPRDEKWGKAWHWEQWWSDKAVSFYAANLIRKYGKFDTEEWTARMIDRVKCMGFNSIGAFSGSPVYNKVGMPHVKHLPIGLPAVPGIRGVFDPFADNAAAELDKAFAGLAGDAANPLVVGYFLANEQGWEDVPRAVPALTGNHACKKRLLKMLEEKYKNIEAFNKAWNLQETSFAAMADKGIALKSQAAFADMLAFNELFLEEYYKLITTAFRKYDKNHMLIGNRWQPGTANSEVLCRVAGKYMDIISINYYTKAIDSQFINRIYKWTGGKPQMWSEFYYTTEKESNVGGGGVDVETQTARGLAYRNYVEGAAALGFVVGIEWFTLTDQAVTGRFFEKYNGERSNTGLFNVLDRPYKLTVAEMVKSNRDVYGVWLEGKKPFIFEHPQFSSKAGAAQNVAEAGHVNGAIKIDGQLDSGWPGRPPLLIGGNRLVSGRESGGTEANFKISWDEQNMYLLVNVTDSTPMKNNQTGSGLWNGDAVEIFFGSEKIDQGGALLFSDRQILLGANKSGQFHMVNADKQPDIKTVVVPAVDGKGYVIEASIPWSALGVKKAQEGMKFLFDLGIDDGSGEGRRCQLMWNGGARNSSDRGAWGMLKLAR